MPMDIFSKEIDASLFEKQYRHTKTLHKPSIDEKTAKQIVERLLNAERPLLYVGGGIMLADASKELKELVDHLSIPMAYTLMGKGPFLMIIHLRSE